MSSLAEPVAKLVRELSKLPGIGPKSAQRLTYYLLRSPDEEAKTLAEAILALKEKISLCSICFNITDCDPCPICQDKKRDYSIICVVEKPSDIMPLERTGKYNGVYHVLHGTINPAEGRGPEELKIKELLSRLQNGAVKEVILATNPTVEGGATALYLTDLIKSLGVKVTRIAYGIPMGSEIEYSDGMTLSKALEGRREI